MYSVPPFCALWGRYTNSIHQRDIYLRRNRGILLVSSIGMGAKATFGTRKCRFRHSSPSGVKITKTFKLVLHTCCREPGVHWLSAVYNCASGVRPSVHASDAWDWSLLSNIPLSSYNPRRSVIHWCPLVARHIALAEYRTPTRMLWFPVIIVETW